MNKTAGSQHVQSVVVEGDTSDEVHVASGVPQGTVLGPLLFLLYIIDLGQGGNSTIKLFADDCILLKHINTETDSLTLQQDLDTVVQWSEKWQMSYNSQKCSVLTVTKKKIIFHHHYKMCGVEHAHVNQQAYLGLEFASDLSGGPHIQKITCKVSRNLKMIRRNNSNAPQVIKEQTYKTFIRTSVEYAHTIWDPYQQNHINQVERIQRKGVRYITSNYEKQASVTGMRERLGWPTLQQRR